MFTIAVVKFGVAVLYFAGPYKHGCVEDSIPLKMRKTKSLKNVQNDKIKNVEGSV
jgi:hypothetical protein